MTLDSKLIFFFFISSAVFPFLWTRCVHALLIVILLTTRQEGEGAAGEVVTFLCFPFRRSEMESLGGEQVAPGYIESES